MTSKKKVGKAASMEPVEVRKISIRWPEYFAEASIAVAVKSGTPDASARAMAATVLRTLIMQDSILNAMPEGKVADAKA